MMQKVIQAGTVKKITRIWVVQADTTEKSPAVRQNKTKFCNARGGTVRDPVILQRLVLNGAYPLAPIYSSD